jgi:hypothetical protein
MKSWKAVLGYVPGDSPNTVRRKTLAKLRPVIARKDRRAFDEIMIAHRQARQNFGMTTKPMTRANLNASWNASRAPFRAAGRS